METYASEARTYNLGELEKERVTDFCLQFWKEFCGEKEKKDEALYFELLNRENRIIDGPYFLGLAMVFQNPITIKTERLYLDRDKRIMSAGFFNLAEIRKSRYDFIFDIKEHHTIGVNPNFLYEIGETFGRRD